MKKVSEILQKAKYVILNYPLVLMVSLTMVFSIIAIISEQIPRENEYFFIKLIITSSLGISLMFALKMLSQRIGKSLLIHILGLLFLVGYFFILPCKKEDFTDMYAFLLIPSYLLSHLLVAFVPFISSKTQEIHFWQYNKNLFVNFFLTIIFTGVLTGGVLLAILAVEQLFNFDFPNKFYAQTFFTFLVFGSTFIFLLFNENGLKFLEKEGNYPIVLKFFTQFILIPLLFIYVVILYFYSVKILINWELPRGWVSYLVLAYSVIGILALLLVHPLKEDKAKSWVKMFSKIFYFSLMPLLILLFVAIFTRLLAYGFTEARYFVLLLAFWLLTVVLYFVFAKRPIIKFIPMSLFLFGLFALLFPYFNTFSVAKRSQKIELEKLLAENNLIENGKINFNASVTYEVVENIGDKFIYLGERHQQEYLDAYLSEEVLKELNDNDYRYWSIWNQFNNVVRKEKTEDRLSIHSNMKLLNIEGYQYVVEQSFYDYKTKINGDNLEIENRYNSDGELFRITINTSKTINVMDLVKEHLKKYGNKSDTITVDDLSVEFELENYQFKVYFDHISRNKNIKNDKYAYNVSTKLILIKQK